MDHAFVCPARLYKTSLDPQDKSVFFSLFTRRLSHPAIRHQLHSKPLPSPSLNHHPSTLLLAYQPLVSVLITDTSRLRFITTSFPQKQRVSHCVHHQGQHPYGTLAFLCKNTRPVHY